MAEQTYEQQLAGLANQYRQLSDPTAQGTIQKTLSDAVGNFAPEYGEIRDAEAQIMPAFGNALNSNAGYFSQAGYNPSALNQLGMGITDAGRVLADAQYKRDLLNQRRGRLNDIAGNVYNQYAASLDAIQNQASLLSPLYQAEQGRQADEANRAFQLDLLGREQAFNAAQAELDRQLSREAAARSGGGAGSGFTPIDPSIFGTSVDDDIEFINVPDSPYDQYGELQPGPWSPEAIANKQPDLLSWYNSANDSSMSLNRAIEQSATNQGGLSPELWRGY